MYVQIQYSTIRYPAHLSHPVRTEWLPGGMVQLQFSVRAAPIESLLTNSSEQSHDTAPARHALNALRKPTSATGSSSSRRDDDELGTLSTGGNPRLDWVTAGYISRPGAFRTSWGQSAGWGGVMPAPSRQSAERLQELYSQSAASTGRWTLVSGELVVPDISLRISPLIQTNR